MSPATYPLVENESDRLATLDAYQVLDTDPEREFDDIAGLAKRLFGVPIVLVSLVAKERQFFKARIGFDACETAREGSFCTYAILDQSVMVVLDAAEDARFAAAPFQSADGPVRFYAGAPLATPAGQVIGSFCLMDLAPRAGFSAQDRETLAYLGRMVMERLEARRLARAQLDVRRQFNAIAATSSDAIICADGSNAIISWNRAAEGMFGYAPEEAIGRQLDIIVPPAMRERHREGFRRAASGGETKLVGALITITACRRNGEEFPIELSLSKWTEAGEPFFGAIVRDITDRRDEEAKLRHAAEFDHLTKLANRTVLADRMAASSREGLPATALMIDLDGFKDVNDSLGHSAGDAVLRVVAERLTGEAGDAFLVSRLGGDEFVIFATGSMDPVAIHAVAERMVKAIERPIEIGERSVYIGASAGIAFASGTDWDTSRLLDETDIALYRAKAEGRSMIRVFTPELRQAVHSRTSISSGIREAWERQEFELFYQPQVRLGDGALSGAEALIRWNHPERGLIAPAAFLSVLETSLLARPVSEWILNTACRQAAAWRAAGNPDFRMGVNLFAAQFRSKDLPSIVQRALEDFDLPPEALELEITENIILRNEAGIASDLSDLLAMGVGIAFDDFGTGYASLTMLKDISVTRLKIDRSFVSGVDRSRKDQTIVEAIARLADGFDLKVIAEGIETAAQAELMGQFCDEGQGYLFGRPMPAARFEMAALYAEGAVGASRTVAGQR